MLVEPWIDPTAIDWTDGMNPLRIPGWKKNNNPFAFAAMQDQFVQAIRNGKGLEPRIYVAPDSASQLIQPGATFDFEVACEPNCWLWALNASGDQNSFLVQITDSVTGAILFSQPVNSGLIQGSPGSFFATPGRGVQFLLSTPHLFAPPSYPIVRIVNTEVYVQFCRVNLFTVVEYDQ